MAESTSAAAVANTFLDIQEADAGGFPRIDAMKMQKLLYYAQAWWLAIKDEPLFPDEIYAWPWGPVIPNIYGTFMGFGRHPIVGKRATEMVRSGQGVWDFTIQEPKVTNPEIKEFLQSLWDSHKQFTGIQLSNATHGSEEPWTIVKNQYGTLENKPLIPNDLIKGVFKKKLPSS